MPSFPSGEDTLLRQILDQMIPHPLLHGKWINTLSFLENVGARKIFRSESATDVDLSTIQHAAEEARHAFYLKKQLAKIPSISLPTYQRHEVLGGVSTFQYLDRLDLYVSRSLKKQAIPNRRAFIAQAYGWVTYAVEMRALPFYQCYQDALNRHQSPIQVKSIITEEEQHLKEMKTLLHYHSPEWNAWAQSVCDFERQLFHPWLQQIQQEVEAVLC